MSSATPRSTAGVLGDPSRLRGRRLSVPAWIAWGAVLLNIVLTVATLTLFFINRVSSQFDTPGDPISAVGTIVFSVIGALIITRHARHALGWLFVGLGITSMLGAFFWQWGTYGVATSSGSAIGAEYVLWIAFWLSIPLFALEPTLVLLLFPNGRFESRASRIVGYISIFAASGMLLSLMASGFVPPETTAIIQSEQSPFGTVRLPTMFDPGSFIMLLILCSIASITLLLRRLRRARGVERQQLKWVAYAMSLVVVTFAADFVARANSLPYILPVTGVAISLAFALLPITIGIAIQRYHLFEIDRVISRTIVYLVLSIGLAGAYLLVVVALHQLLDPFTGSSNLEVAATTLVVAALVRPLRNRIQSTVDRRFYRRHYNAGTEIDRFAARLREQTDLDALTQDIRAVIQDTMQPSHISVWVRPAEVGRQ